MWSSFVIDMRYAAVGTLTPPSCAGTASATTVADGSSPSSASTASEGGYPATVETKFGPVTIEERPERIVALGWGDAETALALGAQPVGAADWLEFGGEGVGPWAEGLYDEAPEIIATLEPSYEAIAALEPDLILDVRGSGDAARHDLLAQIAPTIGVPEGGDSYLTTQEQQVTMIATALGVPEEGAAQLAAIEESFAAARDEHPDWAGKTVTAATKTSEGWGAYIEGGGRVEFLEALGFVQSPTIAAPADEHAPASRSTSPPSSSTSSTPTSSSPSRSTSRRPR